jgi:hypothetical protein
MGIPRYAAKQDSNAPEIVQYARLMGCFVKYIGKPVDLLIHTGKSWQLVEIKDPAKEGHKDEFTKDQREFFAEVAPWGADIWVWRTTADVARDLSKLTPENHR